MGSIFGNGLGSELFSVLNGLFLSKDIEKILEKELMAIILNIYIEL
jgi:hypothetical protein